MTFFKAGNYHRESQTSFKDTIFLRSTKEERFLISWATCDRVGVLCTQAKADPCFFVRSAGRSSFQRHFE